MKQYKRRFVDDNILPRKNAMIKEAKKEGKNIQAKKLVGLRKKGMPLFLPHELGYACPVCNSSDEVNLDFSEYNGFLYCYKCNLDIPSCLCVKYYEPKLSNQVMKKIQIINKATKIYLDCINSLSKSYEEKIKELERKLKGAD